MAILKILIITAILVIFCLPFFPKKFVFSLASQGYDRKDRWRNILFVIEALILGCILLCVAPYIKNLFDWIFNLDFIKKLVGFVPERLVYIADVLVILVTNILVYIVFFAVKKIFRKILDKSFFKDASSDPKKKKDKKKKKEKSSSDKRDRSEKRLKLLRSESVIVFSNHKKKKKKNGSIADDYKYTDKNEDTFAPEIPEVDEREEEEVLTLKEYIVKLWNKFIGVFYDAADGYEYVKTGTYRWAKELKIFIGIVSVLYLAVCLVILLPVFFSFGKIPGFYTVSAWLVSNAYMYPMLSLIFLFELLWFIDGEHKKPDEVAEQFITFADSVCEEKKTDLPQIRKAIMDKYAEDYNIKNFETEQMGGKSTYEIKDKKEAIRNIAKSIRSGNGTINGDYMQSLEHMFDGKHVLFDSSLYSALGEYIIHYLFVKLSFGTRVLFICKDKREIENASSYLYESFRRLTGVSQILWRICTFEKLHEGEKPDILLLTPEQFLEHSLFVDGKEFFRELEDVFVLDADKIINANNYYCLIMAKKLEKATSRRVPTDDDLAVTDGKHIRYSFFSNGHILALGNSIRQFFNLEDASLEAFHSFGMASKNEVYVWHTGVSSTLYVDNGANQVALEVQIAKDARVMGIKNINLVSETTVYSSQVNEIGGLTINHCDLSDSPVGYVVVADDCFNLPNAIFSYSRYTGRTASVLHVVSKPYLLRDYFTAKAESYVSRFELIGKTMCEHAVAKRANTIILLCDAVNGIEQSAFVDRTFKLFGDLAVGEDGKPSFDDCLRRCYEEAFGYYDDEPNKYTLVKRQDSELNTRSFIYINRSAKLFQRLLETTTTVKLEYMNTRSEEYIPVFKDEIAQHFIPGQILVRNNHAYTIKNMDVKNGVLVLDDTGVSVNVPMDYIQTRRYAVEDAKVSVSFGHDYRTASSVVSHVDFTVYDTDIAVETSGYYSIEKAVQNVDLVKPNFAKYVNLKDSPNIFELLNRKIKTKMLVVSLETTQPVSEDITYSLAVILHEFMKTAFPDQYRCVSVCPIFENGDGAEFFEGNTAIRDLYPIFSSFVKEDEEKTDRENGGRIRFAVIEDIDGGNGVVETLTDGNGLMVTNMLHVAADFLAWVVSCNDYKYLNFGYDTRPAVFNLEKLEEIIRQFRLDVEHSELVRMQSSNTCFFCHKHLESENGCTLEDGRVICSACAESSVDTFEALDAAFAEVMGAIKASTSVPDTFPENISIDFVSTAELKKRFGSEDAKKLPLAYCNHVTGSIYVEYGLPASAACAVMARMITELWQDINVRSDGSPMFFAHPDYVEIQVLSALRFNSEAENLSRFYEGREGLSALRQALKAAGTTDSFAFFLNKPDGNGGSGVKPDGETKPSDETKPGDETKPDGETEEDPYDREEPDVFVADRDPENLYRFWYNTLNDDEKTVYDSMYTALMNHQEKATWSVSVTNKRVADIIEMVHLDNPHIFWYPQAYASIPANGEYIILYYSMTPAEVKKAQKQIEKAIKPFLKGIKPSMSDYEVVLRAHENIIDCIDYDSLALDDQEKAPASKTKPDHIRSVYGVFVDHKAVCMGYACAFQYLLNRMGIECTSVVNKNHAWSLIKLESDYYYVDVTFDDGSNTDKKKHHNNIVSYDYFCVTTEEILRSRKIQWREILPDCTAVKCNYHVRNKMFFKEYDAARIRQIIVSALNSGKRDVSFKAKDSGVLAVIKDRLLTRHGLYDIIGSSEVAKPLSSYKYHYVNDDINTLHIVF